MGAGGRLPAAAAAARLVFVHLDSDASVCPDACSARERQLAAFACRIDRPTGKRVVDCRSHRVRGSVSADLGDAVQIAQTRKLSSGDGTLLLREGGAVTLNAFLAVPRGS
jgi:hypothetical protein